MAKLILTTNTRASFVGFTPLDAEIAAGLVDLFYLASLQREVSSLDASDYAAVIERVTYSNPFEIGAYFKNITVKTASAILDRVLFYKEAKEARAIANAKAHQEWISMKIDNACKLADARKKFMKAGMSDEEAAKLIGEIAVDQSATLRIEGPRV